MQIGDIKLLGQTWRATLIISCRSVGVGVGQSRKAPGAEH